MKMSEKIEETLKVKKLQEEQELRFAFNYKEVKPAMEQVKHSLTPEIEAFVKELPIRVGKVFANRSFAVIQQMPYDQLHGEMAEDQIFAISYTAKKGCFPTLILYVPTVDYQRLEREEAERKAKMEEESRQRIQQLVLGKLKYQLEKQGLTLNQELEDFIKAKITKPYERVVIEGNRQLLLKKHADGEFFGEKEDNIFAIASDEVLYVFVKEVDYRAVFARCLVNKTEIPLSVAMSLAEGLDLSEAYHIRRHEFEEYCRKVAHAGRYGEGTVLKDYLQQNATVRKDGAQYYYDADDEFPSAVIVCLADGRKMLNIYCPRGMDEE